MSVLTKDSERYQDLSRMTAEGDFRSLYLFSGDEDYLIDKAVSMLKETLIEPSCASLDFLGLRQRVALDQLGGECAAPPFLSRRRLIVLHYGELFGGREKNENYQKDLIELLAKIPDSTSLVFIEEKIDQRQKKILRAFADAGGVQIEMKKLSSRELMSWMAAYLKKKGGLRVNQQAAETLMDRCEFSMRQIALEMDKIASYCQFRGQKEIFSEDIDYLCREDLGGNVFLLMDYISQGKTEAAMQLLDQLIKKKEAATLIHFMLSRQFRQLLVAKDMRQSSELASALGVRPFAAKALLTQSGRFSDAQLEDFCRLSFESDLAFKSGLLDERLSLELLICRASERLNADWEPSILERMRS